jgi:hypothetical protein
MKGSVKLPVFIDDARKYVNTTQLRAKYLGASYEAEYCQWQTLHGLRSLMETASLIITPNAYLEGKLIASYPPDPIGDFDVVRATTATRVNSAGLVELVPYNLLTYSQDFTNADWAKDLNNGSFATNATAPDGTLTAQTLTAGSGNFGYCYRNVATASGNQYAFSFYAKKGTSNFAWFQTLNSSISYVNLTTLAIAAASGVTATATNVGNDWVRIVGIATASSALHFFSIGGSDASGNASMTSGNTIQLWGAQLVEGSTAKDYQKTETRLNIPRLDYSNGTCPSLLVEPQRTNAVTYSEFFSAANGYNYQNASQSGSSIVSPSGLLAYGITSTTSANDFHRYYKTLGGRSGVNTTTIFAKKGTSRYLGLGVNQNGSTGNNNVVVFDLQDGVIASNTYGVTASIEDFGDGWYRLVHTFNYGTGGTYADICVHNTGTSTYTINAFQTFDSPSSPTTIYVWGLQMEVGSYATSYIPTTSASVTRNADVISKTGISSLIGQTEGTIFWEVSKQLGENDVRLSISNSSTNDWLFVGIEFNNLPRIYCNVGGVNQFSIYGTQISNDFHKVAFAYKANDFALYIDGVQVITHTSGNVPTCSRLDVANIFPGADAYATSNNKAVALWKTRLTNTQLAELTSL